MATRHFVLVRPKEFEVETLRWMEDVFRFAMSLTRDETEAEDIVQDTYLRAHRSWHTFEPGTDCRRWLFTICRNVFLRSRERDKAVVALDGKVEATVAAPMAPTFGHRDDPFSDVDVGPAIGRALSKLPEPFRKAVILVDVQDQSYETAAAILGVPIGTVRSRLFRGRRLLQDQLLVFAMDAGILPAGRALALPA